MRNCVWPTTSCCSSAPFPPDAETGVSSCIHSFGQVGLGSTDRIGVPVAFSSFLYFLCSSKCLREIHKGGDNPTVPSSFSSLFAPLSQGHYISTSDYSFNFTTCPVNMLFALILFTLPPGCLVMQETINVLPVLLHQNPIAVETAQQSIPRCGMLF